ncbi:MAG: DNA/RNA non-specific endonuclease [Prevotella sp.]|nr:DNA/RNA non-specific endonuclease [Prevotella sp.]
MKTKKLLLIALFGLTLAACGDDDDPFVPQPVNNNTNQDDNNQGQGNSPTDNNNANKNATTVCAEAWRLEFPKLKGGSSIPVVHTATLNSRTGETGINYTVEWDTDIHAQRWSCYQMYESIAVSNTSRYTVTPKGSLTSDSQYPNDEFLSSQYQFTQEPYWGTGYDHGHICPSADRLGSYECNRQTFYLTNMQPQVNGFNAGIWEKMESQVRTWNRGSFRDTLYVVKGGTIDSDANIIKYVGSGANKIPVPKYFFMALLCKNSQGYKALGFWIQHSGNISENDPLANYAVNIDELEEKTGIDFFCNLPDDVEDKIESLAVDNVKRAWGLK